MYQIGTPVRLTWTFTDANGDPQTPDAVTAHITQPDATTAGGTATVSTVGTYYYDFTPTQFGLHSVYFAGTGANASNGPVDVFVVQPLTSGALISLADAKQQLRKTSDTDDAEIIGFIQAATGIVNRRCGYSAPTTFVETVEGRADASARTILALSRTPVLSVQSITTQLQGLPVVDISSLVINNDAGVIYLGDWFGWYGPVTVTYTAGRSTVPAELRTACRLLVQWLWDTRRAGAVAVPNSGGDETVMVDGLELPARAVALMDMSPYTSLPGIA